MNRNKCKNYKLIRTDGGRNPFLSELFLHQSIYHHNREILKFKHQRFDQHYKYYEIKFLEKTYK
jgi:hypothetical protein